MAAKGRARDRDTSGFTEAERAAMKERVRELQAKSSRSEDGEADVRAKIASMPAADRRIAQRLHALVKATAPTLTPRTWYGMPAYARDGEIVCFFQPASKFKTRYSTLGFSDEARLDEDRMWPTAYALAELGPTEEARIATLLAKALS